MLVRTPIVVLHRYAYSDSSWIVKTLSPDFGILSLLVKGGKSKNSPFKAALDPLAFSELVINYSVSRELHLPREASLKQWFPALRSRLPDLAMAQVMVEVLLKMPQMGEHNSQEFSLLYTALERLEQGAVSYGFLAKWFLQLGQELGYSLDLSECVQCGANMSLGPVDLWPAQGGGVCNVCLGNHKPAFSAAFIQEVQCFLNDESSCINAEQRHRLEHFFLNYLKVHTGVLDNLRSWPWLLELRKSAW